MLSDAVAVASIALGSIGVVAWRWFPYARRRDGTAGARLTRDFGAGVATVAFAALVLLAMGRAPTYERGPLRLWSGNIQSDQNSQQVADPYSVTHITHGIGFYALLRLLGGRWPVGLRAVTAVALECTWEVIENTDAVINRYRAATFARGYYGDSVVNSVGDMLAAVLGFALAALLPVRATVLATIVLEIALLAWIRDSLLLNILMLLWPIDAIRAWQQGGGAA